MPEAVIVSTARTAIGRAMKGTLVDVDAFELAEHAVVAALQRSGIDPRKVDDMVLAETRYGGGDIARYVAIEAGLEHIPGAAVNRHCAAGLTAVTTAAGSIKAGMDNVVSAGGAHSMSTSPQSKKRVEGTNDWVPWLSPSHRDTPAA